jgi:hypothetical protein
MGELTILNQFLLPEEFSLDGRLGFWRTPTFGLALVGN